MDIVEEDDDLNSNNIEFVENAATLLKRRAKDLKEAQTSWSVHSTEVSLGNNYPSQWALGQKPANKALLDDNWNLSVLGSVITLLKTRPPSSQTYRCSRRGDFEWLQGIDHGGFCVDCNIVHAIPRTIELEDILKAHYKKLETAYNTSFFDERKSETSRAAGLQPGVTIVDGRMIGVLLCWDGRAHRLIFGISGDIGTQDTDVIEWGGLIDKNIDTLVSVNGKSHSVDDLDYTAIHSGTFCQCAAPKMIVHAIAKNWKPLAMAEMWFNVSNKNDLTAGLFCESCDTCKGFIGTLLCDAKRS